MKRGMLCPMKRGMLCPMKRGMLCPMERGMPCEAFRGTPATLCRRERKAPGVPQAEDGDIALRVCASWIRLKSSAA